MFFLWFLLVLSVSGQGGQSEGIYSANELWRTATADSTYVGYTKKKSLTFDGRTCDIYLQELTTYTPRQGCLGKLCGSATHDGYWIRLAHKLAPIGNGDIPLLQVRDGAAGEGHVQLASGNIDFTAGAGPGAGTWCMTLFNRIFDETPNINTASLQDKAGIAVPGQARKANLRLLRTFQKKPGPGWYQTFGYIPSGLDRARTNFEFIQNARAIDIMSGDEWNRVLTPLNLGDIIIAAATEGTRYNTIRPHDLCRIMTYLYDHHKATYIAVQTYWEQTATSDPKNTNIGAGARDMGTRLRQLDADFRICINPGNFRPPFGFGSKIDSFGDDFKYYLDGNNEEYYKLDVVGNKYRIFFLELEVLNLMIILGIIALCATGILCGCLCMTSKVQEVECEDMR